MSGRLRDFLADLWFDLRERRLAPIVLALGVATFAVPIVLGGSESARPPDRPASPPAEVIETDPAVSVSTLDGVRDASDRLAGRVAKNPFRQQLRSLPEKGEIATGLAPPGTQSAAGAATDAGTAQITAESLPSAAPADSSATDAPGPAHVAESKRPVKTRTVVKLERHAANLRFGALGERRRIEGVEGLDVLPGRGDPVMVLLGVDQASRTATFDLASRVISVWGRGRCAPARGECDYLTLKPGEGAKLRYEPRGADRGAEPVVYSLSVVKIETKRVAG